MVLNKNKLKIKNFIKYTVFKISRFLIYKKLTTVGKVFIHKNCVVRNSQNNKSKILIGTDSHICGELNIFSNSGEIIIGERCFVGDGTRIWSSNKIQIGNDVLISHNVNIIDTNAHEINALERAEGFKRLMNNLPLPNKSNVDSAPIKIENHVWINFNCSILKGVTIGEGAIIAAGTIITKNVLPYTIMGGSPAKILKYLEK